jgi:sugar lactone lactonase YvrE
MEEVVETQSEELIKNQVEGITSISEDSNGSLFISTVDGFIYEIIDQTIHKVTETGGQPFNMIHDSTDSMFITDLAHQAIYSYTEEESLQELIKSNEGFPFLGPNSLAFHESSNSLFFTDSGPMGDTSLLNPKGSVYVADVEQGKIKAILAECLAHPAGIAITADGKSVYVAETYKNRILKIVVGPNGNHHASVFFQFSGRVGPTSVCVNESGILYVAHFEFPAFAVKGKISVISPGGVLVKVFACPVVSPDCMVLSRVKNNVLFMAGGGRCFKVTLPGVEPKMNSGK